MKGPRSRHKFNVHRVWECPACKKRAFALPQVTTRACECRGKDGSTWMCLLDAKLIRLSATPETTEESLPQSK